MATITKDAATVTPDLVLSASLSSTQYAPTIEHTNLVGSVLYTLRPDPPRSGTLELFFLTEWSAEEARLLHSSPGVFDLDYPERPSWTFSYVRKGAMKLTLDTETRSRWLLEVGFSEVLS